MILSAVGGLTMFVVSILPSLYHQQIPFVAVIQLGPTEMCVLALVPLRTNACDVSSFSFRTEINAGGRCGSKVMSAALMVVGASDGVQSKATARSGDVRKEGKRIRCHRQVTISDWHEC